MFASFHLRKTIFISCEIVLFVNKKIEKKLFNLLTKIYFLLVINYSQIVNQFSIFIIIIGFIDYEKSICVSGDFTKNNYA